MNIMEYVSIASNDVKKERIVRYEQVYPSIDYYELANNCKLVNRDEIINKLVKEFMSVSYNLKSFKIMEINNSFFEKYETYEECDKHIEGHFKTRPNYIDSMQALNFLTVITIDRLILNNTLI